MKIILHIFFAHFNSKPWRIFSALMIGEKIGIRFYLIRGIVTYVGACNLYDGHIPKRVVSRGSFGSAAPTDRGGLVCDEIQA